MGSQARASHTHLVPSSCRAVITARQQTLLPTLQLILLVGDHARRMRPPANRSLSTGLSASDRVQHAGIPIAWTSPIKQWRHTARACCACRMLDSGQHASVCECTHNCTSNGRLLYCRYKLVVATTEAVLLAHAAEPAAAPPRKLSWRSKAPAQAAQPEQDAATCACWLGAKGDAFAVGYASGVVRLYSIPELALGVASFR